MFAGSAEQSLIELYLNKEVSEDISYVSATPCVRLLDNETPTHQETFMKVELTRFVITKEKAQTYAENFTLALELMQSLTKDKLVIERQSETQVDIVREFDNLELGSYGYRQLDNSYIVYGTGIALPRFQFCDVGAFHNTYILRHAYNTGEKIIEEALEFEDALQQSNPMLSLYELTDLLGAIDGYTQSHYNLSIDDLLKFSNQVRLAKSKYPRHQ